MSRAASGNYAIVGDANGEQGRRRREERRGPTPLQWLALALLTVFASVVLVGRVKKYVQAAGGVSLQPLPVNIILSQMNLTQQQQQQLFNRAQKKRRWSHMFAMGRTGTSAANFLLRSRRKSMKKHAAKAVTRSVVLVGSQFALGNELLKRVFGELCQRTRLALRCEPVWGGAHDLKSLAGFKGKKKRLVWLESDARKLRKTFRGVRTHASDYRVVHVLWDPMQACSAQWPLTQAPGAANVSLASLCQAMRLGEIPPMFKRAKRDRVRVLQPRLEDLVSRKPSVGPPAWRQLFKFLELPERSGDLTAIATRAIQDLEMRGKVLNRQTPSWVHAAIAANETLYEQLRSLRHELEYATVLEKTGASVLGALGGGRQLDA